MCETAKTKTWFGQLSSAEESDSEESCHRVFVGKLDSNNTSTTVSVKGIQNPGTPVPTQLAADTGISKTLLNRTDWYKVGDHCKFVKTSKQFRRYETAYYLPIKGKGKQGEKIST